MVELATSLKEQLGALVDPLAGLTLAEQSAVSAVAVEQGRAVIELRLGYPLGRGAVALSEQVRQAALAVDGVDQVAVDAQWRVRAHKVQNGLQPLPGVKNIIAVASGKGGVGKSTTSVNLALALRAAGAHVGVLDADIYGPSIPRMLGMTGKPESRDGHHLEPLRKHGLQAMSIGFMVGEDTPMIWRGPMVTQALQQMLTETHWDDLDYLIIDLPPGTGDIQLTLCQRIPVSAALIVTTPQDIALLDARRALQMFRKVEVPVLGVIENMSIHVCSQCGHAEPIFGSGGGERMAAEYGVELLGQLPLAMSIREQADGGVPSVVAEPDGPIAQAYLEIAQRAAARLACQARSRQISFPSIVVQDS
ncbi:MAG: iron-sulfur cluster carrier protein ApbC [Xanthomonadales bacterium]|nr:iron-sulfur cluster carrier protein ApbC [Xanthomonadales bacterium]MCB1642270.1 iron-sulfur cluster carrier protein ApbC [Xanthomonadales bacterium]